MDLFRFRIQDPAGEKSLTFDLDAYVPEASDGFSMPRVERYEERSPAQHGALDRGFRLLPRRLAFRLALRAASAAELAARRADLIDVLRPHTTGAPSTLFVTLPDGTIWSLAVFCNELVFQGGRSVPQTASFQLSAPTPVFSQYVTPQSLVFGQAEINSTRTLVYGGTWSAVPYPFSLCGPLTHPVIRNLNAGTRLELDLAIEDMQVVNIDLRSSYKTITCAGVSLIEHLSSDSDLEGFALLPAPEAPQGCNLIQVTGDNTGEHTRVSLSFVPVRVGL